LLNAQVVAGVRVPGVFGVAPYTIKRAPGESNKDAWDTGEESFSLKGIEYFVYYHLDTDFTPGYAKNAENFPGFF
jgi:hypothetical protein